MARHADAEGSGGGVGRACEHVSGVGVWEASAEEGERGGVRAEDGTAPKCQNMITESDFKELLERLSEISHGGSTPMGLEAVVMALVGSNNLGKRNVVQGLAAIDDTIRELTEAVSDLTKAVNALNNLED